MKRAETWTRKRISYSQTRFFGGYRTDCSGYVSMAWGLDRSLTTWTLPRVAKRIGKSDLKPGDVLLNNSGGADRHVVIFGGWQNRQHTRYIAYEESGSVGRAVKRVLPYPHIYTPSRYKPWRFVDIGRVTPVVRTIVKTAGYVDTVRGPDRYVTAVRASSGSFPRSRRVVIASGENWADALSASSLAGAVEAPLLLTRPHDLPGEVEAEIRRLQAREILIVGGAGSVPANVARSLARLAPVRRIAGIDRYKTAEAVANETVRYLESDRDKDWDGTVMIASGANPIDALAATPLASGKAWPLLLSTRTSLSPEARRLIQRIGVNRIVMLGSPRAVDNNVMRQLEDLAPVVDRVGAEDRYGTSAALATYARKNGMRVRKPAVVTNAAGPDAVAAGVAAGAEGDVLLVTRRDELSGPVARTISENRDDIDRVRAFGGTLTTPVMERIARNLGAPVIKK